MYNARAPATGWDFKGTIVRVSAELNPLKSILCPERKRSRSSKSSKSSIELPGAEDFARYLDSVVDGTLIIEGSEVYDFSYGMDFGKKWVIRLDGEVLGAYFTEGPKPGADNFRRRYNGKIPGYVDPIYLVFSEFYNDPKVGTRVQTPWQRQDNHDIPFP
jgi:hypothetical protein